METRPRRESQKWRDLSQLVALLGISCGVIFEIKTSRDVRVQNDSQISFDALEYECEWKWPPRGRVKKISVEP